MAGMNLEPSFAGLARQSFKRLLGSESCPAANAYRSVLLLEVKHNQGTAASCEKSRFLNQGPRHRC